MIEKEKKDRESESGKEKRENSQLPSKHAHVVLTLVFGRKWLRPSRLEFDVGPMLAFGWLCCVVFLLKFYIGAMLEKGCLL